MRGADLPSFVNRESPPTPHLAARPHPPPLATGGRGDGLEPPARPGDHAKGPAGQGDVGTRPHPLPCLPPWCTLSDQRPASGGRAASACLPTPSPGAPSRVPPGAGRPARHEPLRLGGARAAHRQRWVNRATTGLVAALVLCSWLWPRPPPPPPRAWVGCPRTRSPAHRPPAALPQQAAVHGAPGEPGSAW